VEPAPRHVFVILGATGDLVQRKLLPALYSLMREGHLDGSSRIVGVARSHQDDAAFRTWARQALREAGMPQAELAAWCDDCLSYVAVPEGGEADYRRLREHVEALEAAAGLPGHRVFYLALPPAAFAPTVTALGAAGLHRSPGDGWTRLVIEKPFGHDLASARELNALVHGFFDESQVYRIDHYLGKETVQNLLVFRFSNVVFEALWNRERIDNVQITVAEDLGVDGRAGYYDRAGALRDMVQNHVTQVLSLIAMEVPVAYDADAVRSEKIKALRSVRPIDPAGQVVLGQYEAGFAGGSPVPGYRREEGVADGSTTETFAAVRLALDSWRWQGVPFLLRTGKRLRRRVTEIAVVFRRPPVALFESMDCGPQVESNVLVMRLQPDEGFELYFDLKTPGEPLELRNQPLRFSYEEAFGPLPGAYETLLLDVLQGDQTLFVHAEEVEASWRLYAPVLEGELPVHGYAAGSWGPAEADRLLGDDAAGGWRTR
jgi:glucose-6-phosphate 1-dehydrogenase